MKQIEVRDPDDRNPHVFKASDLTDNLEQELEVFLEYHEGSWGTKVPHVIIRPKRRR
jgi:hypothetical protein